MFYRTQKAGRDSHINYYVVWQDYVDAHWTYQAFFRLPLPIQGGKSEK